MSKNIKATCKLVTKYTKWCTNKYYKYHLFIEKRVLQKLGNFTVMYVYVKPQFIYFLISEKWYRQSDILFDL